MADFNLAIGVILEHEGGLSDHPADPGGITNYGISLRFALDELKQDGDHDGFLDGDFDRDGDVDPDDIRKMTVHDAVRTYRQYWWDKFHYDIFLDQQVATKVFDCSVNMGDRRAHKLSQQAANACGLTLVVDGVLGAKSFYAINSMPAEIFVKELCRQQAAFYRAIVDRKPSMGVFLRGWLRRAAWPYREIPT